MRAAALNTTSTATTSTCWSTTSRPCRLHAAALRRPHNHHATQQRRSLHLRAVPADDAADKQDAGAAAGPAAEQPRQQPQQAQQPPSSRLSNLADSLGSQKSFVSEEEWRVMDKKVNKYPCQRVFNAIGTGGDQFKANMLQAVESVVGTVHVECVSERPSSGGKYVSVRIGPVWVETADQVIAVFSNMRKDAGLKWYM